MLKWCLAFALSAYSCLLNAADWRLDGNPSSIYAISTKSSDIAEIHKFSIASAVLKKDSDFLLSVDPSSLSSGLASRDELMRSVLFEVANFPNITLSAEVPKGWLARLDIGVAARLTLPASLMLHGESSVIELNLLVTKLSDDLLLITAERPLILNLERFGFTKGLRKLAHISQLEHISSAVPIIFTVFIRKNVQ